MERSRKLIITKRTPADDSLFNYFEGNKSKLADYVKMSRTTITNFFGEKPVREFEFRKICLALRLNWKELSKVDKSEESTKQPENEIAIDTETMIREVRERCRQNILDRHSRMRLLSGYEIEVDRLYVDVWLLDRPEHQLYKSPENLLKIFDIQKDRLALAKRVGYRNPGFEVANKNRKLVILGKPGAGKTTFLKHLAVDWCKGKFQPDSIALLIEFRRIRDGQWGLMYAIEKELGLENWQQIQDIKQQIRDGKQKEPHETIQAWEQQLESLPLQVLLKQGKLLILMDGLDEVPTNELRQSVHAQLYDITTNYGKNRFILTSRTQIIDSIPDSFSSVEVADFNGTQVELFVRNWFFASDRSHPEALQQWQKFDRAVGKNPALKELTVTPVLLSLMCLVLQDEGEMPSQIDWLYQKGIKLLLSKWNNAKEIDGWELGTESYRQLSIEQKEALLTEIAARKFENPNNFVLFTQEEITTYIANFLQLTDPQEKIAVLKAIEAQHGLLIERADELWSFSHLTFQEHFTLRWLFQLSDEQLTEKLANQRWQEVVKQLVKSQQPGDKFVLRIKQAIDRSIKNEPILQKFLTWVLQKSASIPPNYKPTAIRAFYFALDRAIDRALAHNCAHDRNLDLDLARTLDLNLAHDLARTLDLDIALDLAFFFACGRDLDIALDIARDRVRDPELTNKLEQLKQELSTLSKENQEFQQWQQANGIQWNERLRQIAIEHRNIGHDWQFSNVQKQQLQHYYDANKFLIDLIKIDNTFSETIRIDLINIGGTFSDNIRTEIENTLLLPWEELQHFSEIY